MEHNKAMLMVEWRIGSEKEKEKSKEKKVKTKIQVEKMKKWRTAEEKFQDWIGFGVCKCARKGKRILKLEAESSNLVRESLRKKPKITRRNLLFEVNFRLILNQGFLKIKTSSSF